MLLSVDSETTGIDLKHGAAPFFVTTCDEQDNQLYWEWNVDPLTRKVQVPRRDIDEIEQTLLHRTLVLQNAKFDIRALHTLGLFYVCWPYGSTYDTLFAGHLLASNQPHDLTSMALIYLGIDILPYENALERCVQECRRLCRSKLPTWRIAKKGLKEMPSAKEKTWKYDSWLPRAVAKHFDYKEDHVYWIVLRDYANMDSAVTLKLWQVMEAKIKECGLWEIYETRLKLLPIVVDMEERGVTINRRRLNEQQKKYGEESKRLGRMCLNLAKSYDHELTLPKSGNNKSLVTFCFDVLKLPTVTASKKTGKPSLDKNVLEHYEATLPERSKSHKFVVNLRGKRKCDTLCSYAESYERFWLPYRPYDKLWYRLYPSLNPTGTQTLRWSSSAPNEQNISKLEEYNLRAAFGPAPGREWWSCDAQNLELRLPAYEAGEEAMIELFEHPERPPYYGSYHMRIFALLHPEKFEKYGMECKERFASSWYQWTKNGDFAVGYGSVESSGTADRAYHVSGAFRKVKGLFKAIHGPGGLNDQMVQQAQQYGFVYTMPDKSLNTKHGYPLYFGRSEWGKISPTEPLNYHVSGTAMWWMCRAMERCYAYLQKISEERGELYFITLQVHDELVFDFPKGDTKEDNLPVVQQCMKLMEQGGKDLEVPTPVSCKYHSDNWSQGVSV